MIFNTQPKLSIDRIRVVLPLMIVDAVGAYLEIIGGMKGVKDYKVWHKKNGYLLAALLPVGISNTLCMIMGRTHGHAFVSFDFKPSELTEEGRQDIRNHLCYMPFMEEGNWMAATHTSYIEIAADFPGILVKDVLPFVPTRKSSRWWPCSSVEAPTQYLGARSSIWELRAYDRNACLAAKGKEGGSGPLLRIEISLRRTKLQPMSLVELPNPFENVKLARLNDLPALGNSPEWGAMITDCWTSGSGTALSKSGKLRAEFLERFNSCVWDWWNPAQLWTQYPTALKALTDIATEYEGQFIGKADASSPIHLPTLLKDTHVIPVAPSSQLAALPT